MRRKINPKKLRIIVCMIIGILLIGKVLINLYDHHVLVTQLKKEGIYEVYFTYVQNRSKAKAFYMVCEPPSTPADTKKYIDEFISKQSIVETNWERAKETVNELRTSTGDNGDHYDLIGVDMIFLAPSNDLKIGEFPYDIYDGEYRYGEHLLLMVTATFQTDEQYDISYLWPNSQ